MLSVSLEASFTSDGGFDFGATLEGLAGSVLDADFGDVTFDPSAMLDLVASLAPPELSTVLEAAQTIASLAEGFGGFASGDDLLAPLRALTEPFGLTGSLDLDALAAGVDGSVGIAAIGARFDTITRALETGPIAELFDLIGGFVPDVSLGGAIGRIGGPLGGAISLLTLMGGLMATEAITAKLGAQASLVAGMLDTARAADAADRLRAMSARADLPAGLAAVAPNDRVPVEIAVAPVAEFLRAVHEVRDVWSRGFAFGEASLLGLDVAGCAAGLTAARLVLNESALRPVADLAAGIRKLAEPVLDLPLPDPAASLEAMVDEGLELLVGLRDRIAAYDATGAVGLVTGPLQAVLDPVSDIVGVLESVGTSVSSAIRAVRDLVQSIDLRPVQDAFDALVDPIDVVLDGIESAIDTAQAPIVAVAEAIGTVLEEVGEAIGEAAALIQDALGRVSDALAAVDIAAVQAAIESGLGTVVDTLDRAQLTPYFDASIDVIDTTADVVDAVPFGLLPTDLQQEVVDAVRPIKEIDFDAIADSLQAELAGIVDALDADVLDEVDAAYQAVLEFLASIDPKAAIAEFEEGPFAEFEAEVGSIDPSALLEPVDEALAGVRQLLAGVDLGRDVIDPIQAVFDDLLAKFEELNPAQLLEPVRAEVDALRTQVVEALRLDEWGPTLETARNAVVDILDRVDPEAMAGAFDRPIIDALLAQLPSGSGPIGTIVATLSQAAGVAAEADAWTEVRGWLGETNGRVSIEGRLTASAELVVGTRDDVRALDPAPLVAAAQSQYRALQSAVAALPPGSLLKNTLEPLLAGPSPSDLLGPLVENRARYLARLELDATAMVQLSAAGHSEINAVTDGLRDALMPVTSIGAWLRSLLARFGVDESGLDLRGIVEHLLDVAGPDRLLPALREIIAAIRDKLVEAVDAALAPANAFVADIETTVNLIDIGPIVDEVVALHAEVGAQIEALSPEALLGDVVDRFDALVDRLEAFDPLAPVRSVIDDMNALVETTFDTLRPSILFQDVCDIHQTILDLAAGLDVRGLLQPILDALEGIALQLDTGLEETAGALGRLQAALPGEVTSSSVSASASVDIGVSL